jgi:hypothetical protein
MAQTQTRPALTWREWIHGSHITYWVSELKGDGHLRGRADWGYTTDPAKAIPLSPYWQKRFAADCRHVGYEARFSEASHV